MKTHTHPFASSLLAVSLTLMLILLAGFAPAAFAADYYVDPATGSMSNPGTSASPWSTLEAVFTANKTFQPGDVIHLRSGYHGFPQVKGINTDYVTIQPDSGATPKLRRLIVKAADKWLIKGLDICPENLAPGTYDAADLVYIYGTCTNITLENNTIRGALSITGWTGDEWKTRLGKKSAIVTYAPGTILTGNTLENVSFAITVSKSASNSTISGNTITNFLNDGMRGLADNCTFEYNLIQNNYLNDAAYNHDDFFQSWSTDAQGQVGLGTVYNMVLRGNIFISQTDPNQELPANPQGIGCFDGLFEGWVVENNLVVVSGTSHGISLYGALDCRIVNNTVVVNPAGAPYSTSFQPSVRIFQHKRFGQVGYEFIPTVSGNTIRNTLVTRTVSIPAGGGTADHNLTLVSNYTDYFNDYAGFDFSLKATAPAVDAGSDTDAPTIDIEGTPRGTPFDIGAYEFVDEGAPVVYEGFTYAPTTNVAAAPDSPDDFGLLGTTWTGSNDIITPGLTHTGLNASGNALRFFANVGSVRSIDMSAFPAGYTQVDGDLVTRLGKPGTTLWFLCLMKIEGADATGSLTAGLNLNGAASGGTVKLRVGDTGTNTNWSLLKGATVGASTTPLTEGDTVLVAVRVKFVAGSNNDEVDLFLNPALGPTAPTTPSATLRNLDIGTFDRLEIKGNRTSVIDEIAIATDWSEF